jgi:K+-sensing histidine kinase KdpD
LSALLFASRPSRFIIPFVFIAVLVLVATRYGALVGILGSLLAGLIFAYLLYPPLHSVKVASTGDRSQLAWVVMAGIALSYLLAGPGPHTPHSKK